MCCGFAQHQAVCAAELVRRLHCRGIRQESRVAAGRLFAVQLLDLQPHIAGVLLLDLDCCAECHGFIGIDMGDRLFPEYFRQHSGDLRHSRRAADQQNICHLI